VVAATGFGLYGLTTAGPEILFLLVAVLFLVTLPAVLRMCAWAQAAFGRLVLSGVAELQERIVGLESERTTLAAQRDSAVSAEATALRRLERDIHDGPQQRLVRLALDLGRAERLFDFDPQAARQAVAEALAQTEETLDELRALSRGIAPPILADRGLVAAVGAIAGRSTVPVALDAGDLGPRPAHQPARLPAAPAPRVPAEVGRGAPITTARLDPAVELAAYFVTAEALANVAKHSRATECRVLLRRSGDRLLVTVIDDGVGGAHLAKGHGLAGLADRAQAVGGTLTVDSPPGGPTTVTAELPWQ
jgi:signal transduction histidine kinase